MSGASVDKLLEELESITRTGPSDASPPAYAATAAPSAPAPSAEPAVAASPTGQPSGWTEKKWLAVSIAVLAVVIVAGIVAYVFYGRSRDAGPGGEYAQGSHAEDVVAHVASPDAQQGTVQTAPKRRVRFVDDRNVATRAMSRDPTMPPPQHQQQQKRVPPRAPPPEEEPAARPDPREGQIPVAVNEEGLPVDNRGQIISGGKHDPNYTPIWR